MGSNGKTRPSNVLDELRRVAFRAALGHQGRLSLLPKKILDKLEREDVEVEVVTENTVIDDTGPRSNRTNLEVGIAFNSTNTRPPASRNDSLDPLSGVVANMPQQMDGAAVAGNQLYESFYNIYMPTNVLDNGTSARAMRATIDVASKDAALEASTKAACLLVMHRASQDRRFLDAANMRYSHAIIQTKRQLETPGIDRRTLLRTAHFLSLCEAFNSTSVESTAARPHTFWFVNLLELCHGDPVYQVLLSSPMRVFAIWELLVARRLPSGVKAPEMDDMSNGQVSLEVICNIAVHIVTLASAEQEIGLSAPETQRAAIDRLQSMIKLEGMLHAWMAGYYEKVPNSQYRVADTPFRRSANTFLSTSTIFQKCYVFADIMVTMTHMTYWMCLALLASSRLRLVAKLDSHIGVGNELANSKIALSEYLDNIAMSMPYTKEKECGWSGRLLAIRPMHFLVLHYKEEMEWQKASWCLQCAAELRIVRPPFDGGRGG